eukprot:TRINITY_DN296_c0_g1_i5.p1 TRINITY_DN296_c0_g1~~TRINITY_DN296_c0_g1_i5.p1  ORF type:complete len:228 (+),score=32.75 TRINITY_DN296_c0_g1_i5:46-684(+)
MEVKGDTYTGVVCVTGATGFIAQHLVHLLLRKGYHVHGTVRSQLPAKVGYLLKLAEGLPGRLTLFTADLVVAHSFDEAIAGCSCVFHTASPIVQAPKDVLKELIEPAKNGTLNVLESCKKAKVDHVVLTASTSTVRNYADTVPPTVVTEETWNTTATQQLDPYGYSKILAEKAAWAFVELCHRAAVWRRDWEQFAFAWIYQWAIPDVCGPIP